MSPRLGMNISMEFSLLFLRFCSTYWKKCYNIFDVWIMQLVYWLYKHYLGDIVNSFFFKFSNVKPTGYQVRLLHSTDFGLNISSDAANFKVLST